jgi:chromosome partitioning protein
MGKTIAFLSQKGGVGKSTLARAVACEASKSGLSVRLADLDVQQATSADWHRQRIACGHEPVGMVEVFVKAADALRTTANVDLLVLDGAPRASSGTLEAALAADLVVLPCCPSRDDLVPGLKLACELEQHGVSRRKIVFALVRAATKAETADAREYIEQAGFAVLDGSLPEKPAYRQAQNEGRAVTETRWSSLNKQADRILDSILKHLTEEAHG